MKLIRDKMEMSRKRKDKQDIDNALLVRRQKPLHKTLRGEKLIYAKDTDSMKIQDTLELIVVGADIEALYPN